MLPLGHQDRFPPEASKRYPKAGLLSTTAPRATHMEYAMPVDSRFEQRNDRME
jgi:hypothetical protein